MQRSITTVCLLILLSAATSLGQFRWEFSGAFPDTTFRGGSGGHGAAVDPAGKVWLILFGQLDSIFNGTNMVPCRAINVFNPDGSPASINRIRTITVSGVTDTLFGANDNRGIRAGHDGNILFSSGSRLYKINYITGEGIAKATVSAGVLTSVGVDTLNEVFCGKVLPGNQLQIFDPALNFVGNVTDTTVGFSRVVEVSSEGNDLYWAGYTNHAIYRYHSDFGSFGPYAVGPNDTLMKGFDCESIGWNPPRTRLWASAGSANDRPNRWPDPSVVTNYSVNTWYAWDPTNWTITDSIQWVFYNADSLNTRPRAIAFSPDGNTAYVGCFGSSSYPAFEKFIRVPVSVRENPSGIPNGFVLSQNYPNPFNPSTEINFTISRAGLTTLVVYDMLGREVATLVSEKLAAGPYTATFDASRLSSGTYMYTLTSGGSRISKKMMLVK